MAVIAICRGFLYWLPMSEKKLPTDAEEAKENKSKPSPAQKDEVGGPTGLEPTRYGDWERGGRVSDF